jgi:hypothetical protein
LNSGLCLPSPRQKCPTWFLDRVRAIVSISTCRW